jgi:hypothetical protein
VRGHGGRGGAVQAVQGGREQGAWVLYRDFDGVLMGFIGVLMGFIGVWAVFMVFLGVFEVFYGGFEVF